MIDLLGGCTTETGILVAVAGSDVDTLEFQVGVQQDDVFILDQNVTSQQHDVRGRNLRSNPFELMLLPEDPEGSAFPTVRVLVLGYENQELQAFALTEPPQAFIQQEVVRRNLVLHRMDDNTVVNTSGKTCYRARIEEEAWRWLANKDQDCDGYTIDDTPADCDDQDPAVHPAAREICEGRDTNCDGGYAPATQLCYTPVGNPPLCREGTRGCSDADGKGLDPNCVATEQRPQAPEAYCTAYATCLGADPLSCMVAKVKSHQQDCVIEKTAEKLCSGSITLQPLFSAKSCLWVVVSSTVFDFALTQGSSTPQPSIKHCSPELIISAEGTGTEGSAVLEFFNEKAANESQVLTITVKTKPVDQCSESALSCS